jgi:hypothetical protein
VRRKEQLERIAYTGIVTGLIATAIIVLFAVAVAWFALQTASID